MSKLLCLFFLLILPLSSGEIKNLKIISDSRPVIPFNRFGFTDTGYAIINVSSVSVIHPFDTIDPGRLGFFLLSDDSLTLILSELQSNPFICVLDSKHATQLFTFRHLSPTSYNHTYLVTSPADYSLFFANCAPESSVTMDVRFEVYNLGRDKNYLSVELTQLPALYFCFSFLYFAFSGYWIYLCLQNKKYVHKIHLLMGVLVSIKALTILSAAEDNHHVKITGTPHGWDVLFYVFQFIRSVVFITVIISVGSGWPFLQKRVLIMVVLIPLQVLANVAAIVVGVTGPFLKDWLSWHQVVFLVDVICCCVIVVWCVKGARSPSKLTLFRMFYVVVIGYLFFTRVAVFGVRTMVAHEYQWVGNAVEEIADLAFYVVMFYVFMPDGKNEYVVVDNEKEAAAMPVCHREFKVSTIMEKL